MWWSYCLINFEWFLFKITHVSFRNGRGYRTQNTSDLCRIYSNLAFEMSIWKWAGCMCSATIEINGQQCHFIFCHFLLGTSKLYMSSGMKSTSGTSDCPSVRLIVKNTLEMDHSKSINNFNQCSTGTMDKMQQIKKILELILIKYENKTISLHD